ncbi:MAG: GntR family transcriptional regulator, partial [Firmicutes bacterium]|nr:GntR family transcriptional regulator [Bacillota bacterium]
MKGLEYMLADGEKVFTRSTLSTRLYDVLKDKILHGDAPQGSILDETLLSKYYEVSRNVVRDALLKLTDTGLVVKEPHKPAVVRTFTDKDICDIFDVRLALELLAIKKTTFDESNIAKLESILALERKAVEEGIIKNYVDIDNYFHVTLVGLSGNETLVDLFQRLRDQIQLARVVMTTRRPQRMEEAHDDHKALVLALSGREMERAEDIVERHID